MIGIDVSNYQTPDPVLLQGRGFVIFKVSEGVGWSDPQRAGWFGVGRAAGVRVGGYHFAREGFSAVEQADYYVQNLPGAVDFHAIDMECGGDGLTWVQRADFVAEWCEHVHGATGAPCLIYCSRSWALQMWSATDDAGRSRLASWMLWVADFTEVPGHYSGPMPDGWTVGIHQFTDTPTDIDSLINDWMVDDMNLNDTVHYPPELGTHEVSINNLLAYVDRNVTAILGAVNDMKKVVNGKGIERPYNAPNSSQNIGNTDLSTAASWDAYHFMIVSDGMKQLAEGLAALTDVVADISKDVKK